MTEINLQDTLTAVGCLGVLYIPFILAYNYVSNNYGRLFHHTSEDLSDRLMEIGNGE